MISLGQDAVLRLWNMSTYKSDKMISEVYCCWVNSLYQIDNDRVIVGKNNGFSIVNITKWLIEKSITDEGFECVLCFQQLRDNNTILCGCENSTFCFYDIDEQNYLTTNNDHNGSIGDLLRVNDNAFLSCSFDGIIQLWSY